MITTPVSGSGDATPKLVKIHIKNLDTADEIGPISQPDSSYSSPDDLDINLDYQVNSYVEFLLAQAEQEVQLDNRVANILRVALWELDLERPATQALLDETYGIEDPNSTLNLMHEESVVQNQTFETEEEEEDEVEKVELGASDDEEIVKNEGMFDQTKSAPAVLQKNLGNSASAGSQKRVSFSDTNQISEFSTITDWSDVDIKSAIAEEFSYLQEQQEKQEKEIGKRQVVLCRMERLHRRAAESQGG